MRVVLQAKTRTLQETQAQFNTLMAQVRQYVLCMLFLSAHMAILLFSAVFSACFVFLPPSICAALVSSALLFIGCLSQIQSLFGVLKQKYVHFSYLLGCIVSLFWLLFIQSSNAEDRAKQNEDALRRENDELRQRY